MLKDNIGKNRYCYVQFLTKNLIFRVAEFTGVVRPTVLGNELFLIEFRAIFRVETITFWNYFFENRVCSKTHRRYTMLSKTLLCIQQAIENVIEFSIFVNVLILKSNNLQHATTAKTADRSVSSQIMHIASKNAHLIYTSL